MADEIPKDTFSKRRRELTDNQGAIGAGSTIHLQDWYGNGESWIVETFRVDGKQIGFLQKMSVNPEERLRVMLPEEIMAAIDRQTQQLVARSRRRAARAGAATRKAKKG